MGEVRTAFSLWLGPGVLPGGGAGCIRVSHGSAEGFVYQRVPKRLVQQRM
eukprot:COSAG01_NODE_404_length_17467_cov_69.758650_7_plen_50_part_00